MIRNRLWRVVALASAVGMVGAACGGDDSGDSPTTSPGAATAVATSAAEASTTTAVASSTTVADPSTSSSAATPTTAALPSTVTVEQRFGPTELPVAPERIVASSGPWLDALLAFGVQPVAYIGNNRGDDGLNAWERDAIGDAELIRTENPNFTFPLELVTAAEPDLILMNPYVGADQTQFDLANQIAPTLSRLGAGEPLDTWQEQVTALGKVLGREDDAASIIAGVDAKIASVGAELPALAGQSALLVQVDLSSSAMNVVASPTDPANTFFTKLGMSIPQAVTEAADASGRLVVSVENVGLIDADYLLVYARDITADDIAGAIPGWSGLRAVTNGAVTYAGTEEIVAFYSPGPLSLAWGVDHIRPDLAGVAAG
jgi:iron complex transport system substrate-binding protein